jgi:hypothetical protein
VGALVGMGDVAAYLGRVILGAAEVGEDGDRHVARLRLQQRVVDAAAVDTRWRPGLEPPHGEGQVPQASRQGVGWRISGASALVARQAHVDAPGEEGSHRQHHAGGTKDQADLSDDPGDPALLDQEIIHGLLKDIQVRGIFHRGTYRRLIKYAVRLGPCRSHRWPLAGVEDAELDASPVRCPGHQAAQGIDFLDQMSLADSANGGIATHLADGLDVVGQQQGGDAHTRRRQGGLGPRVAATDHDDAVTWLRGHAALPPQSCCVLAREFASK